MAWDDIFSNYYYFFLCWDYIIVHAQYYLLHWPAFVCGILIDLTPYPLLSYINA